MKNIVLVGFMGTGKSVTGKALARRLGWAFVDLDEKIVSTAGRPVSLLFATEGEAAFRKRESREVEWSAGLYRHVIAAGGGAMLDLKNVRRFKEAGVVICLTSRPEVILRRVQGKAAARPLLAGGNPRRRIEELLKARASAYAKADMTIDTSEQTPEETAEEIQRKVYLLNGTARSVRPS